MMHIISGAGAWLRGFWKDTRGQSAMLEGGLVFIPFFGLMLAIVDYGMVIFIRNTFQHATREAVRYAVTYQTDGTSHDSSIKNVVKTQSLGFLNGRDNNITIRYFNPSTLAETQANSPGNIIEVSVEGYQWGIIAPLLRSANPITLNVRASDRMESLPQGGQPPSR